MCVILGVCVCVCCLYVHAWVGGVCLCLCFGDQGRRWRVEVGEKNAQGKWGRRRGQCSLLLLSPLLKRNNIPSRRQKGNKTSGSTIYDANWDSVVWSKTVPWASRSTSQRCPGFQRAPRCPPINQPIAENAPMSSVLETSLISRDRPNC